MWKEFRFPVSQPFNGLGLVSKQRFPRESYLESQALGSCYSLKKIPSCQQSLTLEFCGPEMDHFTLHSVTAPFCPTTPTKVLSKEKINILKLYS